MAEATNDSFNEPTEINILLLGESGVGKSTFINSCFYYIKYESLDDVLANELQVLIPSKFEVYGKDYEPNLVEVGVDQDQNEVFTPGKSATQYVKTYVFPLNIGNKKYKIRFLDTPGMGDERGVEQDQKNCELILSYISQLKEIHAFCILLKATNTRLDASLSYSMLQILSRLDSTAVNNVLFLFTNCRGQNFTPGPTCTVLKVLLDKIKKENQITIPVSRMNMFCFDNESFRFVASIKNGVELENFDRGGVENSWKWSTTEFWRMMLYIKQLNPHDLKTTFSINDAKAMALNLTQPAVEIIQLIDDNIRNLEKQSRELSEARLTKEELLRRMRTPRLDIQIQELDSPQTVCTHLLCTQIYTINRIRKVHYKQKCCLGCLVNFASPEIIGNPALYFCSAFNWDSSCRVCKHALDFHKHIYYVTEIYERTMDDSLASVSNQDDVITMKQKLLQHLKVCHREYENEKKYILESCAMFDQYLKKNSITSIGNPVQDYFRNQIIRESTLGENRDVGRTDHLQRLLDDYQQAFSNQNPNFSAQEIEERQRSLLNMKHFGQRIGQMYNIRRAGTRRVFQNTETEVRVEQGGWSQKLQDLVALGGTALEVGKIFFGKKS